MWSWPPFDPWRSAWALAEVLAATRASEQALAGWREQRWRALITHVAQASPLYRAWLHGRDPARVALQDLPIVRKPQLMAAFDRWVTDPALRRDDLQAFVSDPARIADPYLGRYVVWESSGSSGEPGLFVQDAAALAVYDALEALRRPQGSAGMRWGERLVFVGATSGHFASIVSIERLRRLNPWMRQQLQTLSILQPTAEMVRQLQALAPQVVATYPTAAVLLAEEQRAGRLQLSLRQVWTGGETLTPGMRRTIEAAFGCRVFDSYGASEGLSLAAECEHGGLHLNSDWMILESVDAEGRAVPPGEPGADTLLTNLANHVQPLIRYALGDRVTLLTERCACGSTLPLLQVQGRCDDILLLGRQAQPVSLLPLALTTVLEDEAGLFDFHLVQRARDDLLLCTGQHGPQAEALLLRAQRVLGEYLVRMGAVGVQVHGRCGETSPPGRSGKRQRVRVEQRSHAQHVSGQPARR